MDELWLAAYRATSGDARLDRWRRISLLMAVGGDVMLREEEDVD